MITLQNIKLKPGYTQDDLLNKITKQLKIVKEDIKHINLIKESIDARKKPEISMVITVDVELNHKMKGYKYLHETFPYMVKKDYEVPLMGTLQLSKMLVVIGSGPAGLFCAYFLS